MSTQGPEWERERQTFSKVNRDSARANLGFDLMMEMSSDIKAPQALAAVHDCMFRVAATFAARLQQGAAPIARIIQLAEAPRSLFWYFPEEVRLGMRARTGMLSDLEGALGNEPLAGKSLEVGDALDVMVIGRALGAREESFEIELFTFTIDLLSFEEGSLYSWIKGHMEALVLATSMLGAVSPLVAGPLDDTMMRLIHQHQFNIRMERALDNQPMVKYRGFSFSESQLGDYAGDTFNYEQKGISEDERHQRIALVQLALKVDLGTGLVIDGELGPDTRRDLIEFGKKHHHPPSVSNPFTQADLLRVLRPPEN